jgi:hypothetical protein
LISFHTISCLSIIGLTITLIAFSFHSYLFVLNKMWPLFQLFSLSPPLLWFRLLHSQKSHHYLSRYRYCLFFYHSKSTLDCRHNHQNRVVSSKNSKFFSSTGHLIFYSLFSLISNVFASDSLLVFKYISLLFLSHKLFVFTGLLQVL